jgi:hypothetical protein
MQNQRNPSAFWSLICEIARSYAANQRAQAKKRSDPLAHSIGFWTMIAAIGTWVAAVLAGAAAYVFWCQLKTMEQANSDSRNAFIASNRAFVFLSSFDASPVVDKNGEITDWAISYIFENTGNTPTKKLVTGGNTGETLNLNMITTFPTDIATDRSGIPGRITTGAIIRPHATSTTEGFILSIDEIQRIADRKDRLFLWGWAEYNDVFAHTSCHRVRYMDELLIEGDFRKVPNSGAASPLKFAVRGNFGDPDDHCTHPRPAD